MGRREGVVEGRIEIRAICGLFIWTQLENVDVGS
jgi:hypothetical protein